MFNWTLDAANTIRFVMVDSSGVEVEALEGFTVALQKMGEGSFTEGVGAKSEVGSGWYQYVATAGESDTLGPVSIKVTADGCAQQNLLAEVKEHVLDEVVETVGDTGYTARQLLRLVASVLFGESTGGATPTNRFRDLADSKDRVTATVDENGNRTAMVLDAD